MKIVIVISVNALVVIVRRNIMGLIDKLYQAGGSMFAPMGKTNKSDGRGGFGVNGNNQYSSGLNSFNQKQGTNHLARALGGNISPNGLGNTRTFNTDSPKDIPE